jgi:acetyl esterase/lipase
MVSVRAAEPDGCPVAAEWVEPAWAARRTVLYLHGGGYFCGSPASYRPLVTQLAGAAEARVLSVGYRLAPEFPFPAGLLDALAAYEWLQGRLQSEAEEAGAPAAEVVLAGDSAGAGLAVSLLLHLKQQGGTLPAAVVLMSPFLSVLPPAVCTGGAGDSLDSVTDSLDSATDSLDSVTDSLAANASTDYLGAGGLELARQLYLGEGGTAGPGAPLHLLDVQASDLSGLPPVLIQAGGAEVLLDDAASLHARLQEHGVAAELDVYPGMFHVFQMFARFVREGGHAIANAGHFIRTHSP